MRSSAVPKISAACVLRAPTSARPRSIPSVLSETRSEQYPDTAAIFAVRLGGKLNLLAFCGKAAVSPGAHAGNIVKAAAAVCGDAEADVPTALRLAHRTALKLTEAFEEAKTFSTEAVK